MMDCVAFGNEVPTTLETKKDWLVQVAALRLKSYRVSKKDLNSFDPKIQQTLAAFRIYQSLVRKLTQNDGTSRYSITSESKTYKHFEKVIQICAENKWIPGEFLMAQVALLGRKIFPLPSHLSSEKAKARYLKFSLMLKGKKISNSATTSEREAIQRAAFSSASNLVVMLLARGRAVLLQDDFGFLDRYSLAYLVQIRQLPENELLPDVVSELELSQENPKRREIIHEACLKGMDKALKKISAVAHPLAEQVNKHRQEVALVLSKLYGLPNGESNLR